MIWIRVLAAVVIAIAGRSVRGQVSAFTDVEFVGDRVRVEYAGTWYELVSIEGVSAGELVAGSKEAFGSVWRKRIGEDLLDVFAAMGVELAPDAGVALRLRRGDGSVLEVDGAPMTRANRQRIWRANVAREEGRDPRANDREVEVRAVLGEVVELVRARHAYARLRGVDLEAAVEAEVARLGERARRGDVRVGAQRLICLLGDGHAVVEGWRDELDGRALPVALVVAEGGVVALRPDRSGFLDEARPYVEAIDGIALEEWMGAVSAYVSAGSGALVRRRSVRELALINHARAALGREASGAARLRVRDAEGRSTREIEVRLAPGRARPAAWPGRETGRIGEVGYFRLERMAPEDLRMDREAWRRSMREAFMEVASGARGVIIDVRGNGGGARDPILAIMPCLMEAGDPARVVNAARYRLGPDEAAGREAGYLENRRLYPARWAGWTEAEREAIEAFVETFRPEREMGEGFSDWHYMVVSPGAAETARSGGDVVVLMDAGCFSATDIFLGALGTLPNVTLMGTPSSGGSARSRSYEVAGLEVRLASMASFQPDGRLYDGNGVRPDVVVERRARDLLRGGGDRQLERALERLGGR
ncbi:MAG: S41 family peptidase [Phycisphaerales bacterium JB059]